MLKLNILRSSARCALAVALSIPAIAQAGDGSYWSEYPRPANVTNVSVLGTQVLIETPTEYHFYSGLHRTWLVHPVTAPTVLGLTNSYCLFQDGTTIYGYSTRTARIVALATSGSATVNIGSNTSSWAAYVLDGSQVNAWSGFFGSWVPLTVAAPPTMGVGSHVVSCDDGTDISCFSAFYGQWVTIPNRGAFSVDTWRNGTVATFSGPDEVAAFSAYTNTWSSHFGFPTGALTVEGQDAYVSLTSSSGSDFLWVEALHGQFLETLMPAGTTAQRIRNCAILTTPAGDVFGYSPTRSQMTQIQVVAPPTITMATGHFRSYAIIDDGVTMQAYSGLTGTTAATPFRLTNTVATGAAAAFVTYPGGLGFAYSSILGQWFAAPQVVASDTRANFECTLRTIPTGFEAFSARTGTFSTLASSGSLAMLHAGSIIGVTNTNSIDVFDPRYGRWENQPTGLSPTFGIHRLTGMGQDGAMLAGYSLFTNAWESIPMQGSYQGMVVNSSVGYATTSSHYYVFTANGSLSTFARFPEFTRFHSLGQPISHVQAGNPGAFVVALLALSEAEIPTPYGVLRVDPNPVTLSLGIVPPHGLLYTPISTPNTPVLSGIELFMQDFLIRPTGAFALSNAQAHYLW